MVYYTAADKNVTQAAVHKFYNCKGRLDPLFFFNAMQSQDNLVIPLINV